MMIYIFDSNGYTEINATKRQARLDVESWNQDHPDDPRDVVECDNPGLYTFESDKVRIKTWDEQVSEGLVSQDEIDDREQQETLAQLSATDNDMARVAEDIFRVYILGEKLTDEERDTITTKINQRTELRAKL
jgi:hypothetical protein